jgi:glycosyltransferase involved in cell wall biosynthesis
MAAGVPVLSTRSGGISDFFDDSCGIVIEPSGLEQASMDGYPQFSSKYWPVITSESVGRAVAEAVEKYYDIASQKAKNAKKRAEEMFSLAAVRKRMSEALN